MNHIIEYRTEGCLFKQGGSSHKQTGLLIHETSASRFALIPISGAGANPGALMQVPVDDIPDFIGALVCLYRAINHELPKTSLKAMTDEDLLAEMERRELLTSV